MWYFLHENTNTLELISKRVRDFLKVVRNLLYEEELLWVTDLVGYKHCLMIG